MEQLDLFINFNDTTKLMILVLKNNNQRKRLHQYMENTTKLKAVGFYCKHFEADSYTRFVKCWHCDHNIQIKDEDYRYGILENNKDEYYYLTCKECDESYSWEPNYNDNDIVLHKNNIIVIGDYIKHNNTPKHAVKKIF